ncbi:MAG: D-alanyl-D-alanine carboxypeptidase [Oscillospiraceae bacterium]|nr:D-alanyl-D-alanine carboxypeptidase [Oscillospiraceae bacterium]
MNFRLYQKFIVTLIILVIFICLLPNLVVANDPGPSGVQSPAVVLLDSRTGRVLYERNMLERRYPASITKAMTTIVVLENANLNDVVTISSSAISHVRHLHSTADLQVGEELTVYQLLNMSMLTSANDASYALAEHVSGNIQAFAELMNEKAQEIGMRNSNFVNPSGSHEPNQYSTAYDLALMGKYAMQNHVFREIVSRTSFVLPPTNKYDEDYRLFTNTNALLLPDRETRNYFHPYATGIKTGFTTPAGQTLLASATRNNFEIITVVMGTERRPAERDQRFLDTMSLFDYGFENYMHRRLGNEGEVLYTYRARMGTLTSRTLNMALEEDAYVLINRSAALDRFPPEIIIDEDLRLPIREGDVVGLAIYHIDGNTYTFNLVADTDVSSPAWTIVLAIIAIIFSVWLIFKFYRKKGKPQSNDIRQRHLNY